MLQLNNLVKIKEERKRVGRGGKRGRYAGRGKEGQKSRTGSNSEIRPSFEGGQMPLVRRIPRRGFTNVFKKVYALVNLIDLEERFNDGDVVTLATLTEKGLVKGRKNNAVKVLGHGELKKKLTVTVNAVSEAAADAIKKAGGSVTLQ